MWWIHSEVITASRSCGISAGQAPTSMSKSTYRNLPAQGSSSRVPSATICGENSASTALLCGYSSRRTRDAAPIPAPRSRNVNVSVDSKGRSSPMILQCSIRWRSRSPAVAAHALMTSSDFQIAALVSVLSVIEQRLRGRMGARIRPLFPATACHSPCAEGELESEACRQHDEPDERAEKQRFGTCSADRSRLGGEADRSERERDQHLRGARQG